MAQVTHRGPTQLFFDMWSRFYDLPAVQRMVYRPVQDAVVSALAERDAPRVLDVGCGTGLLTTRLADDEGYHLVAGVDLSFGMLEQAEARSRLPAWVQGDSMRLPFPDGCFDAVVSTESLHWYPDQVAALREFNRVLAPGGRMLVALVNPVTESVSWMAHAGSQLANQPFWWPTRQRMRDQVASAGFRMLDQRTIARRPGRLLIPAVLTIAEKP